MKKKKIVKKNKCTVDGEDWIYSAIVKEHFFHPVNLLFNEENYRADGVGTAGNAYCGDIINVWIKVNKKTRKIKECKWRTFGCASAIAAASIMSLMVTENGGMNLEDAQNMQPKQIVDRLGGLPDRKLHCSVLGHKALKDAVLNYLENK